MTILLPALAVAFAAFCVWLTVRIVNRRERWAKWTALITGIAVGYPFSSGPIFGLQANAMLPPWAIPVVNWLYSPLLLMPEPMLDLLKFWGAWWYFQIH